jgi:calcium/calmodulin-dependent protein kinase I
MAEKETKHCGTKKYMAPEVFSNLQEYTKSVDVWAIGIILYEVLSSGKHPFINPEDDS